MKDKELTLVEKRTKVTNDAIDSLELNMNPKDEFPQAFAVLHTASDCAFWANMISSPNYETSEQGYAGFSEMMGGKYYKLSTSKEEVYYQLLNITGVSKEVEKTLNNAYQSYAQQADASGAFYLGRHALYENEIYNKPLKDIEKPLVVDTSNIDALLPELKNTKESEMADF